MSALGSGSQVANLHMSLGDPSIEATSVTGGVFPDLGEWRLSPESADREQALIGQHISRGSLSAGNSVFSVASPQGLPYPAFEDFYVLDVYASVLLGILETSRTGLRRLGDLLTSRWIDESALEARLPSMVSSRLDEPRAKSTAAAAKSVAKRLAWPDSQLATLLGVSRQTWWNWVRGSTVPRTEHRRRLFLLRHVLDTRQQVADDVLVWFESPIARDRTETPADLYRTGNDALVATLASSAPIPEGDDESLRTELPLAGLVNLDDAEVAMRDASIIEAEDRE